MIGQESRLHHAAELSALRKMLAEIPEEDVIDRLSLEARLKSLEGQAGAFAIADGMPMPAKARLTFRGKPVIGSHGILADFGSTAVSRFTDAVAAVAASFSGPLSSMGPIPNRGQHQLLITSTAVGSFGFELEEHRTGLPLEESSPIENALEQTQALLQGTLGSDDDLADTVVGADPRALGCVRSFLQAMADAEATCTFEFKDRAFRFTDVGQVRRSLDRLSQDNLHESDEWLTGELQGVLPTRRTFEFQVSGRSDVIAGKIASSITDTKALQGYVDRASRIHVAVTRVGSGRPRYVLLAEPEPLEVDG
ncbi:hypothetical protein M2352_000578 [Azospirillum fermentarium]|uniref:hypothetical protein n=1 Tax=Azospirillum fermentarium TaxID=1233114 RepID=UPI002226E879|nr:hypothetical protein [Azospirillum fermentarium]MCW2244987.1 hypothetical protein [Azospirillum fermentarium]